MPEHISGFGDLQVLDQVEVDHVDRALHLAESLLPVCGLEGGAARLPAYGKASEDAVDRIRRNGEQASHNIASA
jgi:hypothetical protein